MTTSLIQEVGSTLSRLQGLLADMDAASPVAGETCAVSVKAHVFLYNSHEQKWNSLGDRALSRVQVFKRRQGEQAFYRIVARCENAPANTPVSKQLAVSLETQV